MDSVLVIDRSHGETRVAVVEDGVPTELFIERDRERGVVGNIYRGRVSRVLRGLQAAFVDIGLERTAFLHVDDVAPHRHASNDDTDEDRGNERALGAGHARPDITELLQPGMELTVQVAKEPLGSKGARLTAHLSIPGRYVVLVPGMTRIAISKRITDEKTRNALKAKLEASRRDDEGFIVRTVASDIGDDRIAADVEMVRATWAEIRAGSARARAPEVLGSEPELAIRSARDLASNDVSRILVGEPAVAKRVRDYIARFSPEIAARVEAYDGASPLFRQFGIEAALERALSREISLANGASVVFDETEALTAIDVNTRSFVGSVDLESTLLETNLEAADEIARQLRLRNLGGIIIVDFIDMKNADSRTKVYRRFCDAMARDHANTQILAMSGLGVVEMTRRRTRPSLGDLLTEPCPTCARRGRIRSKATLCRDILRAVRERARRDPSGTLVVSAMSDVARALTEEEGDLLVDLERELDRSIVVDAALDYRREEYRIGIRPAPPWVHET